MTNKRQDTQPQYLQLSTKQIWQIQNKSLMHYDKPSSTLYNGCVFELIDSKTNTPKLRVEFNFLETQFITQTARTYTRVMEPSISESKRLQRLRYARTYESFQAFEQMHLNKFSKSRNHHNESKLQKDAQKANIYIAWIMIPPWAKSEAEYRGKWGAIANDIPFTNPENHVSMSRLNDPELYMY